jgi:hypothetical protein
MRGGCFWRLDTRFWIIFLDVDMLLDIWGYFLVILKIEMPLKAAVQRVWKGITFTSSEE